MIVRADLKFHGLNEMYLDRDNLGGHAASRGPMHRLSQGIETTIIGCSNHATS